MQHVDLKNKRIMITGAAGFIGSYLVQEILRTVTPVTVIGIDNMNDYYDVPIKEYRLIEIEKRRQNIRNLPGCLSKQIFPISRW